MSDELFSWGRPDLLVLLWALIPVVLFALWALRSRRRALDQLALAGVEVAGRALAVARLRVALTVVGLALCLLALAQPRYGYQWRELQQEGRALVVVLDVSRSMDAQDVSPSRMERARRELIDLAEQLRGDKIGLVLAAGGAYPRMPLTLDYDAFVQIVRDSSTATLKAQGSDLGRAIQVAHKTLGPAGEADRAILIVSDGEDHVGKAREAAQIAADDGVRIYALGVGTPEGAPVPEPAVRGASGGFKKDEGGSVVLTRLDRDLLADLARIGGGGYADSVAGTSDTRALYDDGILGALQAAVQGTHREKVWTERFQWPLGLGLLLLTLGMALRPGRARRRTSGGVVAAGLLLLLPLTGRAQDAGDPQAQVDALLAEQADHPGDLDVAERLGEALFRAGDYNRAYDVLTAVADQSGDRAQQARARYNAGHAAYQGGRLTRAVDAWNGAAQLDPENQDAAKNAQAVQQEIARRLQQEPPPQDQDGDPQDGEPQDGDPQGGDSGAPQDGQPQGGDSGAPQDGEPQGGDSGAPQDGQPQDGEPQDGQPQDGEQQDAQAQDGQQQTPPPTDGSRDAQPGEDDPTGEQPGAQDPTAARDGGDTGDAQQGEVQAAGEGTDEEGEDPGEVSRPGSVSEQEADRLFESIEEGSPRVVLDPDSDGGKDW